MRKEMKHIVVLGALFNITCLLGVPGVLAGCCSGGACPGCAAYGPSAGPSAPCCGQARAATAYGHPLYGGSRAAGLPACCPATKPAVQTRVQTRGPVRGSDLAAPRPGMVATTLAYQQRAAVEKPIKSALPDCCKPGSSGVVWQEKEFPLLTVLLGGSGKRTEKESIPVAAAVKAPAPVQPFLTAAPSAGWNKPAAPAESAKVGIQRSKAAQLPSCCAPGPGLTK